MNSYSLWKSCQIISVLLVGFLFVFPDIYLSQASAKESVNSIDQPAVDHPEGVRLLMEVDMKYAIDKSLDRYRSEIRRSLRIENIMYRSAKHVSDNIIIKFDSTEKRDLARKSLKQKYSDQFKFTDDKTSKDVLLKVSLTQKSMNDTRLLALQQNITVLRKRIIALGISKPVITQHGLDQIVIQLQNVKGRLQIEKFLETIAMIEFRIVDESADAVKAQASGKIPPGYQLYTERDDSPILLKSRVMLTGEYIIKASAGFDFAQQPSVTITLESRGAKLFYRATSKNVARLLAVVLIKYKTEFKKLADGSTKKKKLVTREVINVARIQEPLSKNFQITGLDSPQEAITLAVLLNAGALAAPVYLVEEYTIGANQK